MAMCVYVNRDIPEAERRASVFQGDVHLLAGNPSTGPLVAYARELIQKAFGEIDPETCQYRMDVADFVTSVSPLKGTFTNSDRTKELVARFLLDLGYDPDDTYLRLPPAPRHLVRPSHCHRRPLGARLRRRGRERHGVVARLLGPPDGQHRLRLRRLGERVPLLRRRPGRCRPSPAPRARRDDGQLERDPHRPKRRRHHRVLDSGKVRFSFDLRTISVADLASGAGPRNLDAHVTGSTLQDFLRVGDLAPLERV
jgi:hypothetical protein